MPISEDRLLSSGLFDVMDAESVDDATTARPGPLARPWPVRVLTLGQFQIEVDGVPLSFVGKVARRPLELLQFIVASGGAGVAITNVLFALWRDLEGDRAKSAFNVALHRLRKLLGNAEAVVLELGKASLNPRQMWVDCHAFERLADSTGGASQPRLSRAEKLNAQLALAMYNGHFLHETEDEPWKSAYRARLASKFRRTATQLARHHAANGDSHSARALLERGLELDPLAEDLARELMGMLFDAGEQAAALNVFDHCRCAIAERFEATPSPATLDLVQRIRSMQRN